MPAQFTVDPRSGVPIYLQLIDQVKRSIALGTLAAGERLPTVKQLAVDLTINPNTVARAYRDLEREGIIETSPGRGSFVPQSGSVSSRRAVADVCAGEVETAVRNARSIGLSRSELEQLVADMIARWYPASDTEVSS